MISIIGAGPSGNHLAYLLSKHKDVHVYEEHKEIGKPVQCTGIVTSSIKDNIQLKNEFIVNKINNVLVVSPSKDYISFKLKNPNIIINRELFDKHLAEKAIKNGAKYHLNTKFLDYDNKKIKLKTKNKLRLKKTDILVGADGPLSKVAKTTGLFNNREFAIGLQTRAKFKELNKKTVKFFLGYGSFAWVVPESEYIARVGIVSKHNPKLFFKHFLEDINVKNSLELSSGIIPIYDPKLKIQTNNTFLIGDAATQCKATTFGGIIQGLTAAENLSKAIKTDNNYTILCNKLNKELKYSLLIRKMMDKFNLKDYNDLMHLVQDKKTKNIIQSIDRDYPSKMIFKLIMSQPRLLKFAKNLIKT